MASPFVANASRSQRRCPYMCPRKSITPSKHNPRRLRTPRLFGNFAPFQSFFIQAGSLAESILNLAETHWPSSASQSRTSPHFSYFMGSFSFRRFLHQGSTVPHLGSAGFIHAGAFESVFAPFQSFF